MTLTINHSLTCAGAVFLSGVAVAVYLFPASASAQTPERGVPVTERARPDTDARGVRFGSFIAKPKLTVEGELNDNIFEVESGTTSDYIIHLRPSLSVRSDWNNHLVGFSGSGHIGRYLSNSDEEFEDYNLTAFGRVDIRRDTNIGTNVKYSQGHEDRGSTDDAGGLNPTLFTTFTPVIEFFTQWNRVSLNIGANAVITDYDDVRTSTGTTVNNNDRDRTKYLVSARVSYEIVPQYEAFVKVSLNQVDYDSATDDNGLARDSDGYEFVAGTAIDFGGTLFGNVFAGYRAQDVDDVTLDDVEGITFGADLTWNVTALTTGKASITRDIAETTFAGTAGSFNTTAKLGVDHELLRNMLVGGEVSYNLNDFEGISREDSTYDFQAYVRYFMQRNVHLSARYEHERRASNVTVSDFDKNSFLVRLELQI